MSRYQASRKSRTSEESGAPLPAERLRSLCAAADPSAEPSPALRRRVGELARQHDALAACRSARPRHWGLAWGPAGAAAAIALLVVLGLALAHLGHDRSPASGYSAPPVRVAGSPTL